MLCRLAITFALMSFSAVVAQQPAPVVNEQPMPKIPPVEKNGQPLITDFPLPNSAVIQKMKRNQVDVPTNRSNAGPSEFVDVTPESLNLSTPVSPEHGFTPDNPWLLFTSVELLILRPSARGLEYALPDDTNNLTPEGTASTIDYRSRAGLRGGIGVRLPSSMWDVGVTYTYFQSTGTGSATAPPLGTLYPLLTRPGLIDNVGSAAASNRLNYNVFDIDVGRNWKVENSLALRGFGGVRLAAIDQSLTANYDGKDATNAQTAVKYDFAGSGLTAGGEAQWLLPWGFRLFGKGRGALVYGQYDTCYRETDFAGGTVNAHVADSYRMMVPVMELGAGFGWQYRGLQLRVGYEAINWFQLNDIPYFTDDFAEGKLHRRTGDLGLDGVNFQLGLTF